MSKSENKTAAKKAAPKKVAAKKVAAKKVATKVTGNENKPAQRMDWQTER